jgi:hypothetical protein
MPVLVVEMAVAGLAAAAVGFTKDVLVGDIVHQVHVPIKINHKRKDKCLFFFFICNENFLE